MRFGKLLKRAACLALCAVIIMGCVSAEAFAAPAEKTFTLEQAVALTLKNSDKLRGIVVSKVKKQIQLRQAYAAIADTRRNESTIRFSLLFNIKFPEKHGMPKEIELLTKVPDIQSEIKLLNMEYNDAVLSETAKCEQQYYTTVYKAYEIAYYENLLKQAQEGFERIKADYAANKAKKSDVEYMEKQVSDAKSKLKKAKTAYESAKKKLSSITGADVTKGYVFKCKLPTVNLLTSDLAKIQSWAESSDYTYRKAVEQRNAAASRTETVKSVYSGRYGSDAASVLSYVNSCKSRGEQIDYEVFIKKYNQFLGKIEQPWAGSYTIWLLFFKISIPKEWFKGTYSGERYLEDERYALFVSLTELDEAEQQKEAAYNELMTALSDGFEALNESKAAYTNAVSYLAKMRQDYTDALKDNMAGLVEFTDLYDKKIALMEQQKSIYEMRIDFAKSISSYNRQSANYIADKVLGTATGGLINVEDGISSGEMTDDDTPSWYVNVTGSSYKCEFGVKIPDRYDVTHYELYSDAGVKIGAKTEIGKTITGISTVYSDTSLLTVRFYKDGELKYNAVFDGMQYYGTLDMQPARGGTEKLSAGTWNVTEKGMKSTFSVASEMFSFDRFELYYGDKQVGEGTDKAGLTHLSSTFKDISSFTVKLYYGSEVMAELTPVQNSDGQRLLVY